MKWLKANERPREQDASMHMEGGRGSPVMEQMAHEVYRVVLFGVSTCRFPCWAMCLTLVSLSPAYFCLGELSTVCPLIQILMLAAACLGPGFP